MKQWRKLSSQDWLLYFAYRAEMLGYKMTLELEWFVCQGHTHHLDQTCWSHFTMVYMNRLNSPRVTISHRTTPNDHLVRLRKRKYQWWRCLKWFRGPEWQLANRQKRETVDIPFWFTLCPSVGPFLLKYKKAINRNGTSMKRNDSIPFHFCSCQYIAMSLHFISVEERGVARNLRQGSADQRGKPITNFRPSLKKSHF